MILRTLAVAVLATTLVGGAHAKNAMDRIDPMHTFVTFEASHFGTSTNRGRFDTKEGAAQLDKAGKTGQVELTLDTASIDTGIPTFDKQLQSANFLNAERFPTATFVASSFAFGGDQVGRMSGQSTLPGKTLPVILEAARFNCYVNPMLKREVCGGDFETTIQRSQRGMNAGLDIGVPDAVKRVVQVEAVKQ